MLIALFYSNTSCYRKLLLLKNAGCRLPNRTTSLFLMNFYIWIFFSHLLTMRYCAIIGPLVTEIEVRVPYSAERWMRAGASPFHILRELVSQSKHLYGQRQCLLRACYPNRKQAFFSDQWVNSFLYASVLLVAGYKGVACDKCFKSRFASHV